MVNNDFQFINELATDFFSQQYIIERLSLIENNELTGWEIWLQVEFAMFLETQLLVDEWVREFQYSMDRRISKNQKFMAIDFLIRKKHARLGQYIALEIKQNLSAASCIAGMMKDVCKISQVKGSEDDIRTMWSLGVHPFIPQVQLETLVNEYAESYDVELASGCISTNQIGNTKFAFTVF
ncbi:hypothetical protein ACP43V_14285 [Vibrio genomosp. F10 str. 9ZC157]|uniref:Uncharacterized protein n=1 Tax=Vibrio genomosp. F10 str. ZF-129 TaxID=1187848 RepID=A0A1E5BII7_9VIBR|nr:MULTISPECIES: hypothetical protein [Vibrio]MDE1319894.1 hypothetical protein [Vibrio aestuarianus]OEE37237.1 hypothetical protein A1QO_17795 [Vibrio genomosp. F10 str. ZF-129]OEE93927.1 hypothetical protein A1QM_18730 [Vibrio genomosp. F10 str. 9ZC157]CAH8242605.1 conserved hypothetical protein [Vibrio aestuarianus]